MQSIDTIAEVINKKATIVTSMPASANDGTLIMFLGTNANYITGGLYQYSTSQSTWVQLFAVTAADIGLGNVNNTADAVKHVALADEATTALSANITRTADTTNGDQLQIGSGTAINIVNAYHAATADTASTAGEAVNANITRTADTTNGDQLQIGSGTAINIVNAAHAASADSATSATTALACSGNAASATTATSANVTDKIRVSTPAIGTLDNGDIWIA